MKKNSGFTLIEITVSLTVFAIIMAAISGAYYKAYHDWIRQRDAFGCLSNAQWALEFMSNEIRQSNSTLMDDAQVTVLPARTALYLRLPSGSGNANDRVWYWKGNNTVAYGEASALYRSEANNDNFGTAAAAGNRQELARLIVNTTSGAIFNVTNKGTANSTVAIELNLRPNPGQAGVPGNANVTFRTVARPRN